MNIGASVLIHPGNAKNSIIKPSFGLSVEIWSQFFRLVCFNRAQN